MVQMAQRAAIPELATMRKALYMGTSFEFKFHSARPHQKALFFKTIQTIPFQVRAVVIDKARLGAGFARMNGQELTVEFICRLVFRAPPSDIANDVLIIDSATSPLIRTLRLRLSNECRKLERVRPFKKIVGSDSSREDGLQLADMLAGAIRHYAMGIQPEYYQTFVGKIVDLWEVS